MPHTTFNLPLPNIEQWETRAVLKKTAEAHRYLGELKALASHSECTAALLQISCLKDARDSARLENVEISNEAIYKAATMDKPLNRGASKKVRQIQDYAFSLKAGAEKVSLNGVIRLGDILEVNQNLHRSHANVDPTNDIASKYIQDTSINNTKPRDPNELASLMGNLLNYIKDDNICNADPLVKMAIIYYQFNNIHPFTDENQRTALILLTLYLVSKDLLTLPVLNMSRYLANNKLHYYVQQQQLRETGHWEQWLLYMLNGFVCAAKDAIALIHAINDLKVRTQTNMQKALPKIYSYALLENILQYPFTTIDLVMRDLSVSRITASKYLAELAQHGIVQKEKSGRQQFYIHHHLCRLLSEHN